MDIENQNNQQINQMQAPSDSKCVPVDIVGGLGGVAGIGDKHAILCWSNPQHVISLQKRDDPAPTGLLFKVDYSQVARADFALNSVKLRVNDMRYTLVVDTAPVAAVSSPGILLTIGAGPAILLGSAEARKAGFDELRQNLQAAGVKTTKPNILKLVAVTTGIFFAVLIVLVIVLVIVIG